MSVNVGDVVIGLRGDTARLQADMTQSKQIVLGTMKDIEQYVGYAKSAFIAFGGVLTIGAFRSVIEGAIEFKAKLLDLQSQTGISVTALGAMAKTGKLTQTSLEDIAGASAKLSKAVTQQNEDSKGAALAIAALGINFNTFKQLKPEEQMLAVAKAMQGFENGAGKTTAAMLLFGKSGATLLPFLRDLAERTDLNSKQTEEAAKQAKAYETNLAKLKAAGGEWRDSVVNQMLPGLVKFTEQMVTATTWSERFLRILENIKGNLGVDAIGQQIKKVNELSREVSDAAAALEVSQKAAASVPGGGTLLGWLVDMNRKSLTELQAQAAKESDILKKMANTASPLEDASNYGHEGNRPKREVTGLTTPVKGKDGYADLIKTINERLAQQELEAEMGRKLTDVEKLQAKAYADIDGGLIKADLSQKLYIDGVFQQMLALERLAKEEEERKKENTTFLLDADKRVANLQEETKALQDQIDQFGMTTEQIKALTIARERDKASQKDLAALWMGEGDFADQRRVAYMQEAQAIRGLADLKDTLAAKEANERNNPLAGADRAVKEYVSDVKRAGDATKSAVENSLKSLEDTTVSILTGSNAKQAAKAWVNGIISEIIRLQIVRPMLASIFGGNGSGGFSLSSLFSLFGSAAGGASGVGTGIGAAQGSSFNVNYGAGTNFVPEDGPAWLHKGEAIVPASQNAASAGGKQVSVTYAPQIHIDSRTDQAVVAQQVATAVQQGNRQLLDMLHAHGAI